MEMDPCSTMPTAGLTVAILPWLLFAKKKVSPCPGRESEGSVGFFTAQCGAGAVGERWPKREAGGTVPAALPLIPALFSLALPLEKTIPVVKTGETPELPWNGCSSRQAGSLAQHLPQLLQHNAGLGQAIHSLLRARTRPRVRRAQTLAMG